MDRFKALILLIVVGATIYFSGAAVLAAWWDARWVLISVAALVLALLGWRFSQWLAASGDDRRRQARRLGRWLFRTGAICIVLSIGALWASAVQQGDAQRRQHRDELQRQGYVDTGESVTAAECEQSGGHVDGGFCLTP